MKSHSLLYLMGVSDSAMPVRIPGFLLSLGSLRLKAVWAAYSAGARCSLHCVGLCGCFFLKLDPKTCVCAHLHSECIT